MIPPDQLEVVGDFAAFGVHAFTTTRRAGSFGSGTDEPVRDVMGRWANLRSTLLAQNVHRLATAPQVHGARVTVHTPGWEGWLRGNDADGHISFERGTALAVTVADCVPVFMAHPSGMVALLHSGWRGTAARIVEHALALLRERGLSPAEIRIHLGPAVCGDCYEVSPETIRQVTGRVADEPANIDLRAIIAGHARALGVRELTISPKCTRCHNDEFFSHREGDAGRQLGVIFAARSG